MTFGGRCHALSVTPICVLACTCSCGRILFKCHEMLPGPNANSWPTTACPVCCQTDWQGSLQVGRANGFAYFGPSVITDFCPDLGSPGNILVQIQASFGPPRLGPPSCMPGGLTINQPLRLLQDGRDVKSRFLLGFKEPLGRLFLHFPQPVPTSSRARTEQTLAAPAGTVAATGQML